MVQDLHINLQLDGLLNGSELTLRQFECISWYVAQMRQSLLHLLPVFLLGILLLFSKGLSAIKDSQILQSLLDDFSVLVDQLEGIAGQREHLD